VSPEFHATNLAFWRASIVSAAAAGEPILDLLKEYTAEVLRAERDRVANA
jgi:hypothetical protein